MQKLILWLVALCALPGSSLFAQTITGNWQGTLQVGKDLRVVIKISTTDADKLKAMFYSIDQGGPGVPASSVTRQGSTVKMEVPGIGGTYEGKLSADGKTMAGTWTQGPKPLPLNLEHVTAETGWAIPEQVQPKAMAADANLVFEVATIKPSQPDRQGKGITIRGGKLLTINTTLGDLVTFAYGMHLKQITGAPPWLESEKYDIEAKPEAEGQPNDKQLKTMLQRLITERFKLAFHRDKKELSVYALTVGKAGPKLTKSEGDPNSLPGLGFRGLGDLITRNATMADFAGLLQAAVLDRPVLDQTGLAGRFDFGLKWTPDQFQFAGMGMKVPPPSTAADAPPELFRAIQEQIGLKLEPTKAQTEVLVIDHVEKPSAN